MRKADFVCLSAFRMDEKTAPLPGAPDGHRRPSAPRVRKGPYLGSIPICWLQPAILAGRTGSRPRRTTETALALWFRARCSRASSVQLSRKDLQMFGLDRWAYYRALEALESRALVVTERKPGRRVRVGIVLPAEERKAYGLDAS